MIEHKKEKKMKKASKKNMFRLVMALSLILSLGGCSISKKQEANVKIIGIGEVDGSLVYGKQVNGPATVYNSEMTVVPEYPEEISDYLSLLKKSLEKVYGVEWFDSAKVSEKVSSFNIDEDSRGTICFVPRMYEIEFSLTKENGEGDIYFVLIPKLGENGDCEGSFRFMFSNELEDVSVSKGGEQLQDMIYSFDEDVIHIEVDFYSPDPDGDWQVVNGIGSNACFILTLFDMGSADSASYKNLSSITLTFQEYPRLSKETLNFNIDLKDRSIIRFNRRFFEQPYQIDKKSLLLGYFVVSNDGYDISEWDETVYTESKIPQDKDLQIVAVCLKLYYGVS